MSLGQAHCSGGATHSNGELRNGKTVVYVQKSRVPSCWGTVPPKMARDLQHLVPYPSPHAHGAVTMNAVRLSLSLAAVVNAASSRRGPAGDLHHLAFILLSLGAVFASVIDANGADFTFGYRGVDSVGANSYLVAQQNAQKYYYPYPSNDPLTYWGPSANGVPASLTYRFDFGKPSASVFVSASLASYNFVWGNANGWSGSGTGFNSLWASTDGLGWQLLLDNPTPANYVDSYKTYEQYLPSSLLGSSSLWVQVRMQADNAPLPSYTTSQFSRTSASRATDVFRIEAVAVPEPSTCAMALAGLACGGYSLFHRRKQA